MHKIQRVNPGALVPLLLCLATFGGPGGIYADPAGWPLPGTRSLQILSSNLLGLSLVNTKAPDPAQVTTWNLVNASGQFTAPALSEFQVLIDGQDAPVQAVAGFKRRVLYSAYMSRDLRIGNSLYLRLGRSIQPGQRVEVRNPTASLWPADDPCLAMADPLRVSPAIHVNQVGYVPAFTKQAVVGLYLGSAGELPVPESSFTVVDPQTGATVYSGTLVRKPDVGYTYTPTPYQQIFVADFTPLNVPGTYQVVVPQLGASAPFRIADGAAMSFARAYALGLYGQRCGTDNALPYTRFVHGACHTNQASVPMPQSSFAWTWNRIASYGLTSTDFPRITAPSLTSPSSQLYPFVYTGKRDVSGGHHDAGDYSKYTINSAGLVHCLMFAVDSFPGVASLDNLGIPESGDGISDVMQEAKWEADFLAKIQDSDGGFYFLVYPTTREYETNVLPDKGDPQVVWPKTTSVTAAAVAALAQCASSPRFKAAYPAEAAAYLSKAELGWNFLTNAIARFGKDGAYQKLTHYGNEFLHDDELAWAACELYLATGQPAYHDQLLQWFPNPNAQATRRWSWWRLFESYGCAVRSYAFAARSGRLQSSQLDSNYLAKCQAEIIAAAQDHLTRAQQNAYGSSFPIETKHVLTAGWYFSNERAFDVTVAYQLQPRSDFLDTILSNLNYEGGCNPVNTCFVTGLGRNRQFEMVDQYGRNDRRLFARSGLPIGNIQDGFDRGSTYQAEMYGLSFPPESGSSFHPFYDRWADAYDYQVEFVVTDLARSLASMAFLATLTVPAANPWSPVPAQILLPPDLPIYTPIPVSLQAQGIDLADAQIFWEASQKQVGAGPSWTLCFTNSGAHWIEAEAVLPDGRRVFGAAEVVATTRLPRVSVTATDPAFGGQAAGVFTLTRWGNTNQDLTLNCSLAGNAVNGTDYQFTSPVNLSAFVLPRGIVSTNLSVTPTLKSNSTTAILSVNSSTGYTVGSPSNATMRLPGTCGKIISLTFSPGGATLTWTASPGRVYQVLAKNSNAASSWLPISGELSADSSTLAWTDQQAGSTGVRFYQVILLR